MNGRTWTPYSSPIQLNEGEKVYFKADSCINASYSYDKFVMTGKFRGSGSIMSLTGDEYSTTMGDNCFDYLFYENQSIIYPPQLPATNISYNSYMGMFIRCYNLLETPRLPANLKTQCYYYMFRSCTSLYIAHDLLSKSRQNNAYGSMFRGCTSLVNSPYIALSPTTYVMREMFYDCSNLKYITVGSTSWNSDATTDWVKNVSSRGTFVKMRGVTIPSGTNGIPDGWTTYDVDQICAESYWDEENMLLDLSSIDLATYQNSSKYSSDMRMCFVIPAYIEKKITDEKPIYIKVSTNPSTMSGDVGFIVQGSTYERDSENGYRISRIRLLYNDEVILPLYTSEHNQSSIYIIPSTTSYSI